MIVKYIKKGEYSGPHMTIGKLYEVIGIEADTYRIIDDSDEPYLYESNQFEIVDSSEPDFWITDYGDDGERYSYPPSWARVGFFEDYYDKVETVKNQFWTEYKELYKQT